MEDAEGRWFSFCVSSTSVILLETKTVPDHLNSLPCIDSPTPLATVWRELEDAGEVRSACCIYTYFKKEVYYTIYKSYIIYKIHTHISYTNACWLTFLKDFRE